MPNKNYKVVSVNISKEKGIVKAPLKSITVNPNGILGDAHSGSWHRQISLLSIESIQKFSKKMGRIINPGEFAENITTSGLDLSKITIFDKLKINNVELEVTQIGKECRGNKCSIFRETGKCIMPTEGIFCRVIKSGKISQGDKITYIPNFLKILVITLSDRASRGEYEDKSGPAIVKSINDFFKNKPWKLNINSLIIPDESKILKMEITKACSDGYSIIFTTGGTGIGSRDITPEIIQAMLTKEIPGIMEYIRIKYGTKIPNALLSRSVAGIINKTLIYALPGSTKAVKEYMNEILKTIEHSIFMVNDINAH